MIESRSIGFLIDGMRLKDTVRWDISEVDDADCSSVMEWSLCSMRRGELIVISSVLAWLPGAMRWLELIAPSSVTAALLVAMRKYEPFAVSPILSCANWWCYAFYSKGDASQLLSRFYCSAVTSSREDSTKFSQLGGTWFLSMYGTVVKLSSKTTWNCGETWHVLGFKISATEPACDGEWPR